MRKMKISIILIGFAVAFIFNAQIKAQTAVKQSVLGNGGTALSNGNHRLNCTVGQPAIGEIGSASHINGVGFWFLNENIFTTIEPITTLLPAEFRLEQNYPNPFNPSTAIRYQLPLVSRVEVSICNLLGQKITTLVSEKQPAGYYNIVWDAKDFAAGVYFCRMEAGEFVKVIKLALVQ